MKKKVLLSSFLAAGLMVSGTAQAAEPHNNTVDGTATYLSTGEIVPSNINFTGYDVRAKKLYVDVTIASADDMADLPGTGSYFVDVINHSQSASLLATKKDTSINATGTEQTDNLDIQLTGSLPADYRIVVEVDKD